MARSLHALRCFLTSFAGYGRPGSTERECRRFSREEDQESKADGSAASGSESEEEKKSEDEKAKSKAWGAGNPSNLWDFYRFSIVSPSIFASSLGPPEFELEEEEAEAAAEEAAQCEHGQPLSRSRWLEKGRREVRKLQEASNSWV